MRFILLQILVVLSSLQLGCAEREPTTPLQTFKTYTKAIAAKDTKTMKLLLSSETLKMHEQEAKAQNVSVDDIVKRETLFSEDQRRVEFRNEKIEGDTATLEVKNSFGAWETVPFVKEDGHWKIDKKAYAEQLLREIEENNKQLDDMIDQGKQPPQG